MAGRDERPHAEVCFFVALDDVDQHRIAGLENVDQQLVAVRSQGRVGRVGDAHGRDPGERTFLGSRVDCFLVTVDARGHRGRRFGVSQNLIEVKFGGLVRAEVEIGHCKFEPHTAEILPVNQHPFERRNRSLVILQTDRQRGVFEHQVEIVRIVQQAFEQFRLFRARLADRGRRIEH